ncbi:MAG TPA: 3-isopropylmalate dehydrogenase, partial [Beijerinckiaceae bacterium]|nr:3-isopropylmalate dehydrogenase [Beijerinckiaceae bacterium]
MLDPDFLLGPSTRGARFMLEFEKADEVLRAHRIASTLVVFGSARAREGAPGAMGRWYDAARA